MTEALWELSATEIARGVRDGAWTAVSVCEAFLDRIARLDGPVGAFVEVFEESARAEAAAVDAEREAGRSLGPLAGVPVAIKDVYARTGCRVTCASKMLEGFTAPYSATAVERLERAGAVIVGRTNMDEFAMGSATEYSVYGPTRNPFDRTRTPGGSSGGSAAAVAARLAPIALGSDTGGSVRQPASFCGVPGLKPTYGRVSRYGLVAFASSLDCPAPFGRTVQDLALVMSVIGGGDDRDATSIEVPPAEPVVVEDCSGLRVGVPAEYFAAGLDPRVEAHVRTAIAELERLGCEVVEVTLPHTRYAVPTYYLVATAEASSNLSRYDGVRYGLRRDGERNLDEMYRETRGAGFGPEVKLRILLGTFCLQSGYYDEYYKKATQMRTLLRDDFEHAFTSCDVLAAPVAPTPAFRIGEKTDDPLAMYLSDVLTCPASLAGIPALSVPCGFTDDGLPVGLQLLGPALSESRILGVAAAYERATGHGRRAPALEESTR